MESYKVIGDSLIAGKAKGEIVMADELDNAESIKYLIDNGHIETETKKAKDKE
jgi:hypothetical protein